MRIKKQSGIEKPIPADIAEKLGIKPNAIFGRYPCCDLLNCALRFLLDGKPELAKDDIIHAIYKADGYFYQDVAERLGIEPKEGKWAEEHPEEESNRHGTWVPLGHRSGYMKHPWSEDFRCSLCGYEVYVVLFSPPKCCPKCFAQMDGGEDNAKDD